MTHQYYHTKLQKKGENNHCYSIDNLYKISVDTQYLYT